MLRSLLRLGHWLQVVVETGTLVSHGLDSSRTPAALSGDCCAAGAKDDRERRNPDHWQTIGKRQLAWDRDRTVRGTILEAVW